ncbi:MAG: hypothetical protein IIY08_00890 [Cellulosilyticum sp.]|nr:hypothetical protein [Cellulosilyticum sp.]
MHFKNTLSKLVLCTTLVPLFSESLIANSVNLNPISSTVSQINTRAKEDQIDYTQFITSDKLLLPRNLYILKGSALSGERLNVFYKNALLSLSQNSNVSAFSSYGQCLTGRWLYQTLANESLMPTESFELKVVARTDHGLISQSTSVELVDENNTTPVRLLPIGDSLTRAGVYLSQVMNSIPNVTTLGTRFYPEDSMPVREGRGGWTLERYMTLINSNELDSPFVFPKIVDGENYKGNTRDWKAICYEKTKHSTYNGFQKIARGWKDDGEFLYDKNGYYKYPSIGDVMVDPSLPIGTQWVEWNGTSWQTMSLQPTEFEFNFSKYMVRYKEAFSTGTPTHVSILLGANEFGMNKEIDNVDLFIERLNQVIDSIHDYDSTIKIILCTPTLAPNSNFVTSSWKNFYTEYDLRMKYVTSKLLEAFDTDEALAKQIYIAPMTLTLDTTNGYTYIEKDEISNGVKKRVIDANNSIHPNNEYGQLQMGSTLAAVIQKYR